MDGEMDRFIDKNAKVEAIATGFHFTEGPIWHSSDGYLLFSDIPQNHIYKWAPDEGVSIFRTPSGKSNGLTRDHQGRLIACEHANRRVSRTEKDGTIVSIAERYGDKKLNSPNDVVVKLDGSIYFTDPPYGLNMTFGVQEPQELPHYGVYCIPPDGGDIRLIISDSVPNGLAFSPDETLLYVADTERNHIRVFDVNDDGSVENGRLFATLPGEPLAPDGLKLDTNGNIYVTGRGGIWILNASGEREGIIPVPELPANLCWGDSDWKTLYITARTSVYRVRMNVAGIPVF